MTSLLSLYTYPPGHRTLKLEMSIQMGYRCHARCLRGWGLWSLLKSRHHFRQLSLSKAPLAALPHLLPRTRSRGRLRKLHLRHRRHRGCRSANGSPVSHSDSRHLLHIPPALLAPRQHVLLRIYREHDIDVRDLRFERRFQSRRREPFPFDAVLPDLWLGGLFRMGDRVRAESGSGLWTPGDVICRWVRA